jgi:hypothetical protein
MDSFPPLSHAEPDPAEEIRRLVGEIARRHNIVVAPDDPLFVILTMLELVAGRYLEKNEATLRSQRESWIDALDRAEARAKAAAEGLITAAAQYVAVTTRAPLAEHVEAIKAATAAERAKIDAAAAGMRAETKKARWILWGSAIAFAVFSAVLIGTAIGAWLAPDTANRSSACPRIMANAGLHR